ncbi:hypothetical protein BB560_005339 [Smittium megazygosporum]|uniref:CCHC-type domain-containing protein n=1 Tax=Smittium megazygosporum TaxID=133381 RepID=A0A2T9Z6R0_9FUNG|nr:hypothetical protein BB560_005339 [Smittium megazygosporum]
MNYTSAAKASLPDYNPQKAVDESIYHWYTGGEKQKLKKLCMGGSDCKIGCSWDQFGDNAGDAVESICRQLFDLRMTMQHDRPSKSTYYIVKDQQAAERLLNGPLFYEGKKIEFFQTVCYEEELMTITIPSFKDVQGETLFKAACNTLSKYGTIKDASARFTRGTSMLIPFGMKILLVKTSEEEIPNFIEVENSRIGIFWRGYTPSCNYCKKYGHWESGCPEIMQKTLSKRGNEVRVTLEFDNMPIICKLCKALYFKVEICPILKKKLRRLDTPRYQANEETNEKPSPEPEETTIEKSGVYVHKHEYEETASSIRNLKQKQISSILEQLVAQNCQGTSNSDKIEKTGAENNSKYSTTAPSKYAIANPEAIQLDYLSSEDDGLKSSDMDISDSESDF